MVSTHAAFSQMADTIGHRFIIHVQKPKHHKTIYANVAGTVTGSIKKDSLLKVNKINMVDLQRKYHNLRVVAFDLVLERNNGAGKWMSIKKATVFSLYQGNEFTEDMKRIIKMAQPGDRVEILVNGIFFNEMRANTLNGIGYGGRVCLTML